jgi:hypothetical protein
VVSRIVGKRRSIALIGGIAFVAGVNGTIDILSRKGCIIAAYGPCALIVVVFDLEVAA